MSTRSNVEIKIPTHALVSVPAAGILVLPKNHFRFYATIQNISNTDIWLFLGSQGVVGQGILVPKNGFSYEIDRLNLWKGEVYAIHGSAGTKNITTTQGQ